MMCQKRMMQPAVPQVTPLPYTSRSYAMHLTTLATAGDIGYYVAFFCFARLRCMYRCWRAWRCFGQ